MDVQLALVDFVAWPRSRVCSSSPRVAMAAYVVLRRLFERASNRVADDIGRVLAELSGRAAATPAGQQAAAAARDRGRGCPTWVPMLPPEACPRTRRAGSLHSRSNESHASWTARCEFRSSAPSVSTLRSACFPSLATRPPRRFRCLFIARSLKYGVPQDIIARMLANVLLDLLLGALPIAGDLADMWFRANERNVGCCGTFFVILTARERRPDVPRITVIQRAVDSQGPSWRSE